MHRHVWWVPLLGRWAGSHQSVQNDRLMPQEVRLAACRVGDLHGAAHAGLWEVRMERHERRTDLDWLRVVCILLLHGYHVGMFFNTWGWHVKAPVLLPVLELPMSILHMVRMPLLMLIAGSASALALERRALGGFFRDRVKRLLWPLIFGMFVVVPPQIYAEWMWRGSFKGSYAAFWPSVLHVMPYPKGSLSWHHLWFVAYLFVFSMVALPLFAFLRSHRGKALLERLERWLLPGARVWWLGVLVFGGRFLLRAFPETHDLVRDPKTLVYYGGLFLAGHVMTRMPAMESRLVDLRWKHTLVYLLLLPVGLWSEGWPFLLGQITNYGATWACLCAVLGHARHGIRVERPWLRHAKALAYPFYILHQTVIVLMGWWMMSWGGGPWSMLTVLLVASFLGTWGLCEGAARLPWLRPCLGMGPSRTLAPRAHHQDLPAQETP